MNLIAKWWKKILFGAAVSLFAIPFLAVHWRIDRELSYHFGNPTPVSVPADQFWTVAEDSQFIVLHGTIDEARSVLRIEGQRAVLVIYMEGCFDTAVHVRQGPVFHRVSAAHAETETQKAPESALRELFDSVTGETLTISQIAGKERHLFDEDVTIRGRVFDSQFADSGRIPDWDELQRLVDDSRWLIVDGHLPSVATFFRGIGGSWCMLCVAGAILGVPALLYFLANWGFGRKVNVKKLAAPKTSRKSRRTGRSSSILERETDDLIQSVSPTQQRLAEYLETVEGQDAFNQFRLPMWLRYVSFCMTLTMGSLATLTIVYARWGLKTLANALTLKDFRAVWDQEIYDNLRFMIGATVVCRLPDHSDVPQPPLYLLVGTLLDDAFSVRMADLDGLAGRLRDLYSNGPSTPEEATVHAEMLSGDAVRFPLPGVWHTKDFFFIWTTIDPSRCSPDDGDFAAYLIEEDGNDLEQVSWWAIDDLVLR